MPPSIEGRGSYREVSRGYIGVNTRLDATDVGPGNLIVGSNIDLYERPGVVRQRRGITRLYNTFASTIRAMIRSHSGDLVAAEENDVYVNGIVTVGFDLNPHYEVSMVKYRGRQVTITEVFIANGADSAAQRIMLKFRGTLSNWGIVAPTLTPVAAAVAGALTGDYRAKYTYAHYESGILVHESNPSPASNTVTLAGQGLGVIVTASSDANVTHIILYRTAAGGSVYLRDQVVANATASINSTQADAALGGAVDEDNDPPKAATLAYLFRERIFTNDISTPGRLRWTKRYYPEAQPASNYIDIVGGDSQHIRAITSINGVLIVFTETSIFRIVERQADLVAVGADIPFIGAETDGYEYFELPSSYGALAPRSVVNSEYGIIYTTKNGIFSLSGDFAPPKLLSQKIQNLFIYTSRNDVPAIDFSLEENLAAVVYRGKYYLSYTSIDTTTGENDYTIVMNLENNECWFWNVGFSSFYTDSVNDRLLAGTANGMIEILEKPDAITDNGTELTATFSTAAHSADDDMIEKLFLYVRIDAKVDDLDTLTAMFYVDEVLEQTLTITGNRTRQLLRLPANTRGFTWRVALSYTGSHPLEFHSVETQYKIFASS